MTRVIKLSKGLDINLAGKAEPKKVSLSALVMLCSSTKTFHR